MINFFIKTYGCQANVADSQAVSNFLTDFGCKEVNAKKDADLILINTCAIRAKAEQKFFSYLGALADIKREKKYLKVGIIGCVASYRQKEIRHRFDHVSFVFGANENLLELKQIFKVSIQSILFRLKDLNLINDYYYTSWCKNINRYGWRKNEPDPLPTEKSNCLEKIALKAIDGGYVSLEEAEKIIGRELPAMRADKSPIDLIKLSLAERRKILKAQAEKDARKFNEELAEWESWEGDYDEEA